LGEAGNTRYNPKYFTSAMRIGDEVLIDAPSQLRPERQHYTIPADTVVKGFGEGYDGRTLLELLEEGVHYNCALRPKN
jgi:hypothetical protein